MPLSSYKLNEDLIGLARALQVLEKGTISDLTNRIKEHLASNPNLTDNSRFSDLFNSRRQIHPRNHHNHTQCPSHGGTSSIPIVPIPSHIGTSPIPGSSSHTGMFSVPFDPSSSSQQAIPGPSGLTVHPHYFAHPNYYYTFHNSGHTQ
jgi:hypothetical protein